MAKNVIKWGLLAYVAATFGVIAWQDLGACPMASEPPWAEGDYLMVTYFHSDKRCATCNDMEAFTRQAVEALRSGEAGGDRVRMRILNWQGPASSWYVRKYGLIGNAIVVSDIRNGCEVRFKNLESMWDHAHDRKAFVEYVGGEVRAWMEER